MKFLKPKIISGIVGTLIGISLGLSVSAMTTYRQHSWLNINYPASHTLKVPECKAGDTDPSKLNDTLSKISQKPRQELAAKGVISHEEPSISQLEQITDDALPYIASVLYTPRVHRPKIVLVERLPYAAGFNTEKDEVLIARVHDAGSLTFANSKYNLTYIVILSQYLSGNIVEAFIDTYSPSLSFLPERYKPKAKFSSHPFVEVTLAEVLARQTLDGDKLAKLAFALRVGEHLGWYLKAANNPVDEEKQKNFVKPARLILDILSCRTSEYNGVRLYGMREVVQREQAGFK